MPGRRKEEITREILIRIIRHAKLIVAYFPEKKLWYDVSLSAEVME